MKPCNRCGLPEATAEDAFTGKCYRAISVAQRWEQGAAWGADQGCFDRALATRDGEIARLTKERDTGEQEIISLRARLRSTAQTLIAAVGVSGPCDAEDAAVRAVAEINRLHSRVDELKSQAQLSGDVLARRDEEVARLTVELKAAVSIGERIAEHSRDTFLNRAALVEEVQRLTTERTEIRSDHDAVLHVALVACAGLRADADMWRVDYFAAMREGLAECDRLRGVILIGDLAASSTSLQLINCAEKREAAEEARDIARASLAAAETRAEGMREALQRVPDLAHWIRTAEIHDDPDAESCADALLVEFAALSAPPATAPEAPAKVLPIVAEIEAILAQPADAYRIEVRPDGSVSSVPTGKS